jgi:maltose alpha-D-glucosyltransferase/alpha-amylase
MPPIMVELVANHAEIVRKLGERTAELHRALSSRPDIPDFAPEPFTDFYRHGLYHGMLGQAGRSFDLLRNRFRQMSPAARADCERLLEREADVRALFRPIRDERISSTRTRHHGDYQLGYVLFTGNDVVITNFDGDTTRPMSERRLKRSPMRDVTSMIRSFHYVSHAVLFGHVPGIVTSPEAQPHLEKWARAWYAWLSATFLNGYLQAAEGADFLPPSPRELRTLFTAYLLEKLLLEIQYEIEQHRDWIRIPACGILDQLSQVPG